MFIRVCLEALGVAFRGAQQFISWGAWNAMQFSSEMQTTGGAPTFHDPTRLPRLLWQLGLVVVTFLIVVRIALRWRQQSRPCATQLTPVSTEASATTGQEDETASTYSDIADTRNGGPDI
jgi:hypothetical protein